jgi:hypothetical protein
MKNIVSFILIVAMLFGLSNVALAADSVDTPDMTPDNQPTIIIDTPLFSPQSINVNSSITLGGGKSKEYNFDMKTFLGLGTPHNAFDLAITNLSSDSLYTLSVTYDGVELHNAQYTSTTSARVINCSADQKWIVLIINDRSQTMSCDVNITSLIV